MEKELDIYSVRAGTTKSCGCYKIKSDLKHGLSKHPLYKKWNNIIDRCYKVNHKKYIDYGAIGVVMCDLWKNDFKSFFDWCLANGWRKRLHVDKDKMGDGFLYSPDTCSVLTAKENNQYRRNTTRVLYDGEIRTMQYWCDLHGIDRCTVRDRIKIGMTLRDALNSPLKK